LQRLTFDDRDDYPPEWSRDGDSVFFSSIRSGNWNIYRQGVRDKIAKTVVSGPANDMNPVVSPDGNFLLYVSYSPGDTTLTPRVMRMPLSGGPSEPVMDARGNQLGGHARGTAPVLRCARRPGAPCVVMEKIEGERVLSTFDPIAGRGEEVARIGRGLYWWWDLSPDGTRIAARVARHREEVRIIPLDGGPATEIHIDDPTPDPAAKRPAGLFDLAWSSDGQGLFIAWGRLYEEVRWYRVDLSGEVEAPLDLVNPSARGFLFFPRVSPDGRYVALAFLDRPEKAVLLENF
jgi:dipeptidyl aminopeptidase/acylaminoacyl peptidase